MDGANRRRILPSKGKLRSVMENQDGRVRGGKTALGGLQVSGENRFFTHARVGRKTISGFGISPVLAGKWNTCAEAGGKLLQQLLEALTKPLVGQGASRRFLGNPFCAFLGRAANG